MLRRADPDDCDDIINLVELGEEDIYNRVYSYPKILKLIETAYLAITAIDRDGNVVAFAAFEDYPQVSTRKLPLLGHARSDAPTVLLKVPRLIFIGVGHERNARRQTLQLLGGLVLEGLSGRRILIFQHPVADVLHCRGVTRLAELTFRIQTSFTDGLHVDSRPDRGPLLS